MRRPSAGERSTLEPYFRDIRPLPTLTTEEEVTLAKTIEAHTSALRQGLLGIPPRGASS